MKWIWLTIMLLMLGGCAAAPEPQPLRPAPCTPACDQLTPRGRWQFIHRITFSGPTMAGDLLGVTVIDGDRLDCALLTLEGLTLFSATEGGGTLQVRRALPPFDRPGFAQGLMADVRAIFVHPGTQSTLMTCGQNRPGTPICRYRDRQGQIVDLMPGATGCFVIRTFPETHTKNTTITGQDCRLKNNYRLARRLILDRQGPQPYTLEMTLIEAQPNPTPIP